MSPLTALWVASAIGAALFFMSGALSADALQRLLGLTPKARPSESEVREREERDAKEQRARAAALAANDDRWRNEVARVESMAQTHRFEAQALRQRLDVEIATRAALDHELARARGEITRLEAQLEASVSARTASIPSDVSWLDDDPSARRVPAMAPPRVQVDPALMATVTRPRQSGMTFRAKESENTLEASLERHLSGLLAREPGVIAVLADKNGLALAGVGSDQQQEGVSVLTSLAQDLALRVQELVGLDRIERVELADGAGRALRVRLFDWEAQPLALACLGQRSLVANPDEERVVSAFPRVLRKVWSA